MKRQLLLAAALAPDVRVRILDEPTEGLDPSRRAQVLELLQADARRGTTLLISSHHLGEIERAAERQLFLRKGELLDEDNAAKLHRRAVTQVIALFRKHQAVGKDNARTSAEIGLRPPGFQKR